LLAFALEEFQNRVERIDGICSCLRCEGASFFFLCSLKTQEIKEFRQSLDILVSSSRCL
jgi:hypothetical protein